MTTNGKSFGSSATPAWDPGEEAGWSMPLKSDDSECVAQ